MSIILIAMVWMATQNMDVYIILLLLIVIAVSLFAMDHSFGRRIMDTG